MKKLGITTILLVLVVVAILAIGYLALIGLSSAAPSVGEQTDPTGQKRGPIAYAVFNIQCKVILGTSWTGSVQSVDVKTYPWVNGTNAINQVVQTQKYNPLGWFSSDFNGWITLRVTGPANYIPATYTSPEQTVTQDAFDFSARTMSFGPYTAKFWDAGQYSVHVVFWTPTSGSDSTPKQMGESTQTLIVSGI